MVVGLLIVGFLFFVYGWFIEPLWLVVTNYRVAVAATKVTRPVRVLFLSDIHTSQLTAPTTLHSFEKRLKKLHQQQPFDLICFGGDFVNHGPKNLNQLDSLLHRFRSWQVPMYGVLGNHDYWDLKAVPNLVKALEKKGVKILDNASASVETKAGQLRIIGIRDLEQAKEYVPRPKYHYPDPATYQDKAAQVPWLKEFKEEGEQATILLTHNPDGVFLERSFIPEVTLAGHTHGGQMWPLGQVGRWIHWLMPAGSFITWAGERLLGRTTLIVSKGMGGSGVPFRFGCRPEAVVVTLEPTQVPSNLVIGVSGKKRSGKDTAANMLQILLPGITRIGFSYAVKKAYDALHGTDTLHNELEKDRERVGLNKLGEERRAIDPNYWVKQTMKESPPLLISDVRLQQEAEAVKQAGGILIRMEAPSSAMKERLGEHKEQPEHKVTETDLDHYPDWDYVIHNDGTLLDLEREVRRVLTELLNRHS